MCPRWPDHARLGPSPSEKPTMTRLRESSLCFTLAMLLVVAAAGCGSEDATTTTATGGTGASAAATTASGGATGTGGSGATTATGGVAGSGATGAATSTTGGVAGTGGAGAQPGTGGTGGASGGTGGQQSTGAMGGQAQAGGSAMTGGQAPTGGAGPTGGSAPTGGQAPTGGAAGTGGQAPTGGASGTGGSGGFEGTLKIMALGDSITRSTCYRAELYKLLDQSYSGRFDLVGTLQSDDGCSVPGYDQDHQGYGSALVTETVAGNSGTRECQPICPKMSDLSSAFSSTTPDVVLLHFATNDAWNGKAPADILAAYEALIDAVRSANPKVIILVAKIIPLNPTQFSCSECPGRVQTLNTQIETWAPGVATADSPVLVVDQWTGFDVSADTKDGVHPNASGSKKMADQWFAALVTLF